jgi:LacI family transcriptional regulator
MEPRKDVPIVSIDNYLGGRLAVEHLVEIGRRKIAHVSGPLNWWEARERKRGWEDVLIESKMIQKVEDRFWVEGTWGSGSGERAIRKLLENYPEMDAVFVGNDQMALSVMQVASRLGMKIPEDLAVVGFDGIPDSAYYWPPLSTVYQDQYQLGCTAVRELVQLVEQQREAEEKFEDTPKQMLIKPELIIRESSQNK